MAGKKKSVKKKVSTKPTARGLDGRGRDRDGEIRRKRGDTLVRTLRLEYGEHFLPGFKGTTRLDAVLKKTGTESLHQLLKKK